MFEALAENMPPPGTPVTVVLEPKRKIEKSGQ
jgi:hypothetical protein